MDLDLEIINGKQTTLKINGEEFIFKDLSLRQHFEAESLAMELEKYDVIPKDKIDEVMKLINQYLTAILKIDKEKAENITMRQYKAIRRYMARQDMYDQGFNDKEIDELEKKAVFRTLEGRGVK